MRLISRITGLAALFLVAVSLQARDLAVLRNGFSIAHDHREVRGAKTRLYLSAGDQQYVDVTTENIVRIEHDEAAISKPDRVALAANQQRSSPAPKQSNVANSSFDLEQLVAEVSLENGLDPDFVRSVIEAESNGNARAVSRKGAQGLMQLMPQTAAHLGVRDSFDAQQNVNAGTRYLRELLAKYHNDPVRALAAYNAGAARVQQYHGVPPYRETRAYISKIIRDFNRRKSAVAHAQPRAASEAALTHKLDGN
ncbi:MAG TPA: lytic transglycosylase domain-containing protein [Terriglobales bacterium]|nr:lytic transglycosylase domain-containing protein [Terriglobales bacterium]